MEKTISISAKMAEKLIISRLGFLEVVAEKWENGEEITIDYRESAEAMLEIMHVMLVALGFANIFDFSVPLESNDDETGEWWWPEDYEPHIGEDDGGMVPAVQISGIDEKEGRARAICRQAREFLKSLED